MTPPRFTTVVRLADEAPQLGDLWRVIRVDADTPGAVVLERVPADPEQYRRPGDGLWPRVDLQREGAVTDAELRRLGDAMDAALGSGSRFLASRAPFLPQDQVGPELQKALNQGWASVMAVNERLAQVDGGAGGAAERAFVRGQAPFRPGKPAEQG